MFCRPSTTCSTSLPAQNVWLWCLFRLSCQSHSLELSPRFQPGPGHQCRLFQKFAYLFARHQCIQCISKFSMISVQYKSTYLLTFLLAQMSNTTWHRTVIFPLNLQKNMITLTLSIRGEEKSAVWNAVCRLWREIRPTHTWQVYGADDGWRVSMMLMSSGNVYVVTSVSVESIDTNSCTPHQQQQCIPVSVQISAASRSKKPFN